MPKGRPALSGVAMNGSLALRMSADERAELDAAAAASGKPTSTWARDILLEAARSAASVKKAAKRKSAK